MEYSESLVNFVSGIVTDAVLGDGTLSHLKYLERYCKLEGCDYGTLSKDLGVLVDALRAYRRKKSKVSLKLAIHQAGLCGLTEKFVEDLSVQPATSASHSSWTSCPVSSSSYMKGRGGDIFDEMPGGNNLKQKDIDVFAWRKFVKAIDLGLPSGTMWASCNLGATRPEEYGACYAWGEIEEKDDLEFYWENYSLCNGKESSCFDIGYSICGTQYDAAHMKWGEGWKMPTSKQFKELLAQCAFQWTSVNGVAGALFTSRKNGNSIFLPASGFKAGFFRSGEGKQGNYWSGIRYQKSKAYQLSFSENRLDYDDMIRCFAISIRPVK